MGSTSHRLVFFVILFLIIQMGAMFPEYQAVFQDNQFLMESIHQVIATDLDNNSLPELIVTGKNYTTQEVFIYWLAVRQEYLPEIIWQSDNLFEERSVLWVCSGKFTANQNQLLAITNSRIYFYQSNKNDLVLTKQEAHNFSKILSVAGGDIDGDGQDELIIARIGKITNTFYNGMLQVWKLQAEEPILLAESGLLGNIRSLTAGDLNGDGKSEIVIDEGLRYASGNIHVFSWDENKLSEVNYLKKAASGAIYSMTIAGFQDETRLVTASPSGKVEFFAWKDNSLTPVVSGISYKNELVSVAVLNPTKANPPQIVVVGYPQSFQILNVNQ